MKFLGWPIETAVRLYEGYIWALSRADERVANWWLMNSPHQTVAYICCYLLFVLYLGPFLMNNNYLTAVRLRPVLIVYNLAMTLLNFYIFVEIVTVSSKSGYSYTCQPVDYASHSPLSLRMAAVLWWFFASKLFELADSLFFILRKKFNQLTFLHIYHHCTMPCLWWIGVKWVAGGSSFFSAMLNSAVHTLMYGYYGLSAAFPSTNFWWKKYLTLIQMLQFCIAFIHGTIGLYVDCPFPHWMGWALLLYMVSFIILFSNFYIHAYSKQMMTSGGKSMNKLGNIEKNHYHAPPSLQRAKIE